MKPQKVGFSPKHLVHTDQAHKRPGSSSKIGFMVHFRSPKKEVLFDRHLLLLPFLEFS